MGEMYEDKVGSVLKPKSFFMVRLREGGVGDGKSLAGTNRAPEPALKCWIVERFHISKGKFLHRVQFITDSL